MSENKIQFSHYQSTICLSRALWEAIFLCGRSHGWRDLVLVCVLKASLEETHQLDKLSLRDGMQLMIQRELIAEAFLDRIVHKSKRIELKGESLRKKY